MRISHRKENITSVASAHIRRIKTRENENTGGFKKLNKEKLVHSSLLQMLCKVTRLPGSLKIHLCRSGVFLYGFLFYLIVIGMFLEIVLLYSRIGRNVSISRIDQQRKIHMCCLEDILSLCLINWKS